MMTIMTLNACSQNKKANENTSPIKSEIDVDELASFTQKKDVVLIDVRTPQEIAAGKIPNALEIGIADPSFDTKISALDKSKTYIVYCKIGGRSSKAQKAMLAKGIPKVINLKGGFDEYKKQKQ